MADILQFKARTPKEKQERVAMALPNHKLTEEDKEKIYDQCVETVESMTDKVSQCNTDVAEFVSGYIKREGNLLILLGMINYLNTLPFPQEQLYDIILGEHLENKILEARGETKDDSIKREE